ncbi:MAG TPA: efflux RND transporter periplasmic adaptor subunit [Bryobacteraceae bacterium]|nr:efflux RND transporter periplasmic adaptor subunit [Bryobacteraceae bacterium]
MKPKKIALIVGLLVVAAGAIFASIRYNNRGIITVQTGKVVRQDLASIVTASGEIKPRNYYNLSASAIGPLDEILVKEGDRVHKGQVVARIENTQPRADVEAQKAQIQTALADSAAAEAGEKAADDAVTTAQAGVEKAKAELDRTKLNLDRYKKLYADKLVAKQDFDQKQAEYDTAVAGMQDAQSRLAQARSLKAQAAGQLASAQRRIAQYQATLVRSNDVLQKYSVIAPIDGVVTNLPVRLGETVVPGVQNTAGSVIMTVADMSVITAEVKVDETDIVNVAMGQPAEVTIDAIPNKTFKGHVIEIGDTAIVRSTGVAASQSNTSSQEAKDFKVVVAISNPPDDIRPGLSCTAKITTATRQNAVTIPIQALTVRQKGDLEKKPASGSVQAASTPAAEKDAKQEIQGVFVIKGDRAEFRKVDTGITGATDIEVLSGLQPGDQIVTGSYKVIRTIRNGAKIKVDNKNPAPVEASAS